MLVIPAVAFAWATYRSRSTPGALRSAPNSFVMRSEGLFDDETKAKLSAAGLDPKEVERQLANARPGEPIRIEAVDVISVEGDPRDPATRERLRKQLDEQLERLGVDHSSIEVLESATGELTRTVDVEVEGGTIRSAHACEARRGARSPRDRPHRDRREAGRRRDARPRRAGAGYIAASAPPAPRAPRC